MKRLFASVTVLAFILGIGWTGTEASGPLKEPATWTLKSVPAAPGETAELQLTLVPKSGVKINRYPRIRLTVGDHPGLTVGGKGEAGSDRPPAAGSDPDANYFDDKIEPVRVGLDIAPDASSGSYELDAKLRYFYCVKKSGFCAPARLDVKLPFKVRAAD